jgi:ProP effector
VSEIDQLQQRTQALLQECEARLAALEAKGRQMQTATDESVSVTQTEKTADAKSRNRAKNRAANQAALQQLFDAYPDVFSRDNVRPLKIGIQEDLIADEKLARNRIKRALASYVRNPHYLRSLVAGADRVGLDGQPAGQVSEEEAAHAQAKLDEMRKQRRERQKQERDAARQQAQAAQEKRLNRKLDKLLQLNNRGR